MKKNNSFYISLLILFLSTNIANAGRCSGSSNCKACTTCSSCKYCNSGGSCGVCEDGGSLGKLFLYGGGILFALWIFSDNSSRRKK